MYEQNEKAVKIVFSKLEKNKQDNQKRQRLTWVCQNGGRSAKLNIWNSIELLY
jgi:hypothetical protein